MHGAVSVTWLWGWQLLKWSTATQSAIVRSMILEISAARFLVVYRLLVTRGYPEPRSMWAKWAFG